MIPQLTIFLTPEGQVRAEVPGAPRRPLQLPLDFAQRNPELMAELLAQRETQRLRDRARLREAQGQNVQYVAEKHGVAMARRIWRDGELAFSQALKRKLRPEPVVTPEMEEILKVI